MKNILLIIVLCVFFMIPLLETHAVAPGMHTFYAKPACDKCHPEIQAVLGIEHLMFGCDGCHQRNASTHTIEYIYCEDCHTFKPMNTHTTYYTVCTECHISHGELKLGYDHLNISSVLGYPCNTCHKMQKQ